MATVVTQVLHGLIILAFGMVGLRVARQLHRQPLLSAGWLWTGGTFTVMGAVSLAQSLFAAAAFVSGPGTPRWEHYLWWAPLFNHGRTAALTAAFAVLLALVLRRGRVEYGTPAPRTWVAGGACVAAGAALGTWLGVAEGPIASLVHFQRVVVLAALELVVLLSVLFVLFVRDRLDRLLWLALAMYALNVAIHVLLVSGAMGFGITGAWRIAPVYIAAFNTTFTAVMLALAAARLRRLRRGHEGRGFFRAVRRRVPLF